MTPEKIAELNREDIRRLNRLAALEAQMDPSPAEYRGIIRHWPIWPDVRTMLDLKEFEGRRHHRHE